MEVRQRKSLIHPDSSGPIYLFFVLWSYLMFMGKGRISNMCTLFTSIKLVHE